MEKKKIHNRGFTLVEVIVSMAILAVVIALTCTVILSVFNHYGNDSRITQAKNLGDTVSVWLTDQLRYATELEITDDTAVNTYDTAIQVQNKNVFYWKTDDISSSRNLYGENFYGGMGVKTTAQVTGDRILTVTVVVEDSEGKALYTKENTCEIINMTVAAEEGELDINGTPEENTVKVTVGGTLTSGGTWENPVFCLNSNLVVSRGDYFPTPQDMYNQCLYALEQLRASEGLCLEYNDHGEKYATNQGVRNYVRINYYDKNWPDPSQYLDLNAISAPTNVSYKKPLNERNIAIQPHIVTKERNNRDDFIVIFGRDYGNGNPNGNDSWNSFVLVFVPDKYTATTVDMSSGRWYTGLPTVAHPQWSDYESLDKLTSTQTGIVEFYDTVKKNWHPVDGVDCTCKDFHSSTP